MIVAASAAVKPLCVVALSAGSLAPYAFVHNANDALVVPAGLAFAKAIAKHPQINLYDPDKRHPSLAGSYLSACTILASVYGKSPVGNSYTAGIDPQTARFLQEVAWETTLEYLGR